MTPLPLDPTPQPEPGVQLLARAARRRAALAASGPVAQPDPRAWTFGTRAEVEDLLPSMGSGRWGRDKSGLSLISILGISVVVLEDLLSGSS